MSDALAIGTCGSCGAKFRYPAAKKRVRCPRCNVAVVVGIEPTPPVNPPTPHMVSVAPKADVQPSAISPAQDDFFVHVAETQPSHPHAARNQRRVIAAGLLLGTALAAIVFGLRAFFGLGGVILFLSLLICVPLVQLALSMLRSTEAPTTANRPFSSRQLFALEATAIVLPCVALTVEIFAPSPGVFLGLFAQKPAPSTVPISLHPVVVSPFPGPQPLPFSSSASSQNRFGTKPASVPESHDERSSHQPQKLPAKLPPQSNTAVVTLDRKLWGQADFLLVNPTHYAVAIKDVGQTNKPSFQIVAKAQDEDAKQAQMIAWEQKTPVIGIDRSLTRAVYQRHAVADSVSGELVSQIGHLFDPQQLVPKGTLIAYYDTVNKTRRVGHLLKDASDHFEFCELVPKRGLGTDQPFEIERIVRAQRVQPESEQKDLNDLSVRSSTDLLDYFIYQVMRTIQYSKRDEHQSGQPYVFVDTVQADFSSYEPRLKDFKDHQKEVVGDLKGRQTDARGQLNADLDSSQMRSSGWLNLFTRVVVDREEELERQSMRSERRKELAKEIRALKEEIAQLRQLIDAENRLTSEIRSRLVRSGIKQVERSDRARDVILHKISGNTWQKLSAEDAVKSELAPATHIILTDIRHPEVTGRYQLSMRLVDVLTGEILWEDQGDRQSAGPPPVSPVHEPEAKHPSVTGTWRSSAGDRLDLHEEESGTIHAVVTRGSRDVTFDIAARKENGTIVVNHCTATVGKDADAVSIPIKAQFRSIGPESMELGADTLVTRRGKVTRGAFTWMTFRRDKDQDEESDSSTMRATRNHR